MDEPIYRAGLTRWRGPEPPQDEDGWHFLHGGSPDDGRLSHVSSAGRLRG